MVFLVWWLIVNLNHAHMIDLQRPYLPVFFIAHTSGSFQFVLININKKNSIRVFSFQDTKILLMSLP